MTQLIKLLKLGILQNRMERKRTTMGQRPVGFELRLPKLRVFTKSYWIEGRELAIEPVPPHCR